MTKGVAVQGAKAILCLTFHREVSAQLSDGGAGAAQAKKKKITHSRQSG